MVIEPLSPNPNEPPEDFLAVDYERLEQEKKRKDQEELERLLRNARREEEEAERKALLEAEEAKRKALLEKEEAKRKALEEEEKSRLKFIRQIDKANQEDRRKRKAAHQEALRKEKERIQFWQRRASDWKGVVGVCKILFILFFPALLFEGYAYEGVVRLVNFLYQCWVDLIFSLGK